MAELIDSTISKKARMSFAFAPDTPIVEADVTQLRQVVLNLIANASEALGEGTGTITITSRRLEADYACLSQYDLADELAEGTYAFLEIKDTGAGMDEETKAKIFDPFFTTKFTGRGLGLAAVLGIVRGHDRAITVKTKAGQGTSFKILLPASGKAEVAPPPHTTPDDWRGSGLVLVADDDEAVRLMGTTMLEQLGFSVLLAEDGLQALNSFRERQDEFAFVLLDLMMPVMDGEEFLAELEQLGAVTPIILTSGYNAQDLSQRFAQRRVAAFLQKPFDLPDLAAAARTAIEAHAAM
jgi:two-component system, cell cycle sensor histidine kinase and response regulator CckA